MGRRPSALLTSACPRSAQKELIRMTMPSNFAFPKINWRKGDGRHKYALPPINNKSRPPIIRKWNPANSNWWPSSKAGHLEHQGEKRRETWAKVWGSILCDGQRRHWLLHLSDQDRTLSKQWNSFHLKCVTHVQWKFILLPNSPEYLKMTYSGSLP